MASSQKKRLTPGADKDAPTDSSEDLQFLSDLEKTLIQRRKELPKGSYSTRLFKRGIDKIAQKVGEEAVETIIAAKNKKKQETVSESADLVYHLLMLLVEKEIPLSEVVRELKGRAKKKGPVGAGP